MQTQKTTSHLPAAGKSFPQTSKILSLLSYSLNLLLAVIVVTSFNRFSISALVIYLFSPLYIPDILYWWLLATSVSAKCLLPVSHKLQNFLKSRTNFFLTWVLDKFFPHFHIKTSEKYFLSFSNLLAVKRESVVHGRGTLLQLCSPQIQRPDPNSDEGQHSVQPSKTMAAPWVTMHWQATDTWTKTALTGFTVSIYEKIHAQQHLLFITSLQRSVKRKRKS